MTLRLVLDGREGLGGPTTGWIGLMERMATPNGSAEAFELAEIEVADGKE